MTAVLSADRRYRYRLMRAAGFGDGVCLFVMLNPSTADEEANDPTIRRCLGFAAQWGYAALEVVNLFALRATNPDELAQAADPVGPENDRHIGEAAANADLIVCAWGTKGGLYGRDMAVVETLQGAERKLMRLGVTKNGSPAHPLYLAKDARLYAMGAG